MRVLFISPCPLDRKLGAPKVLIELAEAMRIEGCLCDLAGPEEMGASPSAHLDNQHQLIEATIRLIDNRADRYDVIDYDVRFVPVERRRFPMSTLMVARSILLPLHLDRLRIPKKPGLRAFAGRMLNFRRRIAHREMMRMTSETIAQADLVNVANHHDEQEVLRCGVPPEKIVVIPYGLTDERMRMFEANCSPVAPKKPVVAFVGTFDFRKGATDFGKIASTIAAGVPDVRFRLLGTKGLMRTVQDVLKYFPRELHDRIEVVLTYEPGDLPSLLSDASVGVFPSYLEGFGFGVLEMLAAALPVVAYDAPGPPMMVPRRDLVRAGDAEAMAKRAVQILRSPDLQSLRIEARETARRFNWHLIAKQTVQEYAAAHSRLTATASMKERAVDGIKR